MPKIKKWSNSDVTKLFAWYRIIGDTEISKMLNELNNCDKFSKNSIEKKRGYLKLKRSKKEVLRIMSDNAIIFNLKIKEGETSIQDNHKFVKINNKLISYSRWYYEQKTGNIPQGMIIFYKDFDSLNNDIDNLDIRERGGFFLEDFKTGLNLINYRIEKRKTYNLINWHKMKSKEQSESMAFYGRLLKIKERLENNINSMLNRGRKEVKEIGFYEPIKVF